VVAAASSALAWPGVKGRSVAWGIAVAGGWALAFPLHERIHLLGDTQLRTDTLESAALGTISLRFGDLAGELHASPLDVVANLYVPLGLTHLGSSGSAVSWTCFAEWLLYLSGVARVVKRLGPPPEARIPLTAALALSGLLEVFAGYLDSSGLILAAAAWWWSELLAPLDRDRQAARVWVAGLALLLTHRMGVAMLAPQLWRALGARLDGDRPGPRRWLLALTAVTLASMAVFLTWRRAGGQFRVDLRDLLLSARTSGLRLSAPADMANTLALVSPLIFLAPALSGWRTLIDWMRRGTTHLALVAAAPLLLLLAWLFPVGLSGLGAQRDWDVNTLLGLSLAVAAGSLLALMPRARLVPALAACLPVLVLGAGGWVGVNADEAASLGRVETLASAPGHVQGPQLGHLYRARGNWYMSHLQWRQAGASFDRSFELNPNPKIEILATRSWLMARDPFSARRSLGRARAAGPLPPDWERKSRSYELVIQRMEEAYARAREQAAAPR